MRFNNWGVVLATVCSIFIGTWLYKRCLFLGFHVTVFNHRPGPCRTLSGVEHGAEDMELLPGDKVLMTTGLRIFDRTSEHFSKVRSGVLLFDFNNPDQGVIPVTIKDFAGLEDSGFHGLSSYIDDKTGTIIVHIVNHLADFHHVVEIFAYNVETNTLYHKDTVGYGDPNFGTLNDVVSVGPRQFYVTNSMYTNSALEGWLGFRWCPVVFWDGRKSHVASERYMRFGNGIAKSGDGKFIFVSQIFDREILIFKVNQDNSLTELLTVPLYMAPDNIFVDPETGDLWVGIQATPHKLLLHEKNPTTSSTASKVLRLSFDGESITNITEVLSDDGQLISGSSVAVYRHQQLLVGTVFTKALHCDVKYAQ